MTGARIVVGLGAPHRGDDAVGLEVARRLAEMAPVDVRVVEWPGPPVGLVDEWDAADRVVIVDAVRGGGTPGAVRTVERAELRVRAASGSHDVGLSAAIELAGVLGRLPARLVILGIVGTQFSLGTPLSPAVAAAVDGAARRALGVAMTLVLDC